MDTKQVKDMLTVEDVVRFVTDGLGSSGNLWDSSGRPIFQSIDHNEPGYGSYKLYYYPDSKMFHSYTASDSMDIFELTQRAKHFENFSEAYYYVLNFFGLQEQKKGFIAPPCEMVGDWDILNKIDFYEKNTHLSVEVPIVPENRLELFGAYAAPTEWIKEGISPSVMRQFGIRVDEANERIIIPHRDKEGNLIGIRCRNYNPLELEQGRKYIPVTIGELQETYKHPLGASLYGLYENQDCIRRIKKIMLCESEKSVLQAKTIWGDDCFVVATCGSSLSPMQINLMVDLGLTEVILGYDRENDENRDSDLTKSYESKLLRLVQPLTKYMDVYIIFDYNCILPYKASPTDCGKEKLLTLMKEKIAIPPIESEVKNKRKGQFL